MRVFTAMRSLQTAVPPDVCRSSGSLVRFPTSTTRLMLAMWFLPRVLRGLGRRGALGGSGGGRGLAFRPAHGHVPHDAVGDLQDARKLVERLGVAREQEQVVGALALVVDLVGELPAAPRLVLLDRAPTALDELARTRDDLVLTLLGELGIEHEQHFVCVVHWSRYLLSSLGLVALPACVARECRRDGKAGSGHECS